MVEEISEREVEQISLELAEEMNKSARHSEILLSKLS